MKKRNPNPGNRRKRPVILAALVLSVVIALGTWWFLDYTKDDGLIYPNVWVYGMNLGGQTVEDAAAALRLMDTDSYQSKSMTVNLPDRVLTLTPEQSGVKLDVDGLVQLCHRYGREGNRWQNTQARKQAALTSYEPDVSPFVQLDQDAILSMLTAVNSDAASTLTQPVVTVTGETPDLNLTFKKAQELTDVAHKQLSIYLGTPERSLNIDGLMQKLLDAYYTNDYTPIDFAYDVILPDPVDLDALAAEHTIAPIDAILNETDYTITPEVLGYGFDLEALKALVEAAGEGETVTLSFG